MNNTSDVNVWARACRMREARRDMERLHSQMQHRNGVAVSVLGDAERVLQEIWDAFQDPRTPDQILDGVRVPDSLHDLPVGGWPELREKLYLLGHYLDYTARLLEGHVAEADGEEGGRGVKNPQ